ncbi:hypothetical protein [Micromonospora sp. NBC_00617]|uniref:hypothetical protein n=1 Tax=Micromonospora sp. NBC_00617 TaxID=2903587 RepID=UPI0030E398B6
MTNVAPVVSAVAATIAAIFAGAGLVAAARRENTKWAREELVDSLSAFLDASFTCKGIVKDGIRMIDDLSRSEVDDIYRRAHDVELRMREVQTRLRLLATPEIVDAA